ncbi:HAMP domain-containing sensor histidine kinase [Priestia megaterium]|uniref:sensor histidine kinase n=1 Tax=Priestia megaterium TaxID=1404 RepID=UPI00339299DB
MIILFLVSGVFAIICYKYDPKSPPLRWVVFLLICGSLAGLSRAIIESFIPALNRNDINSEWINTLLYYLRIITGFVSIYFCPYGILMHAITYSTKLTAKMTRILKYVLLIPIPFMLKTTVYVPDIIPDFDNMLYWAVPYIVIACILHLYGYFTEKDKQKKKSRFITLSLMFPVILSALILNYIMRVFNSGNQEWRYIIFFIVASFFVFIWKALGTAGSLNGIRLRYEREAHERTRQAVNQGAALINHAIKNQIYKIDTSLQTIDLNHLDNSSKKSVEIIDRSAKHLMEIMERMHHKTQEIKIVKSKNSLIDLVEASLENEKSELSRKSIEVTKVYTVKEPYVFCDKTHTFEVFLNILRNSIEAVEGNGKIKISILQKNSKNVIVRFSDNGIGIPQEHLRHVTDPFFSTKQNKGKNYGMGLNQCNEVMYKTGGSLNIESKVNEGTTLTLTFPIHLKKGDVYEEHNSRRAN